MDYSEEETDEGRRCPRCWELYDPQNLREICVDCLGRLESDSRDAQTAWSRVGHLLGRSYGIRPTLVLLMAVTWLAVTLMESLL